MRMWISVNDGLPVDDYVLVAYQYLDDGTRFVGIDHISEFTSKSFFEGYYPLSDEKKRFRKMTHWSPLPELPKEER